MIVFWREFYNTVLGQGTDWRCYKGRAKFRNGHMHIYPWNGTRKRLTEFIAFDDKHSPPRVISTTGGMGKLVDTLAKAGAVADHLPPTYIDEYGNIRKTDSCLSLVAMGPDWNDVKEEEFQDAIALPF